MKKLKWSVMAFFAIMGISQAQIKINSTTATTVSSSNITGNSNIALGSTALQSNTTGYDNFASGFNSLNKNTTGYANIALGRNALAANSTGFFNIAMGWDALINNRASYNNAQGPNALKSNTTGSHNIAFGSNTLSFNTSGYHNNAFGSEALNFNTTGFHNIGMGYRASYNNTSGNYNIAIGRESGNANKTGSNNIFLGYRAGNLVTGDNNTIIGANILGTPSMSNHVIIGDGAGRARIFVNQKGAVGIGTTNPHFGLQVGGGTNENSTTESLASIGIGTNTVPGRLILAHAPFDYSYCNQAKKGDAVISGSTTGSLIIASEHAGGSTPGNAGQGIKFVTQDTEPHSQVRMIIDKTGKVLIGSETAPATAGFGADVSAYKLFVTGGILTEEVRVSLKKDWNWADYVFNKNYQLKPLSEVEEFININGHLPNVPSAKEVKEKGLELGTMATIQQEKIEELTLYAIQQQKEIDELKALVKTLVEKK